MRKSVLIACAAVLAAAILTGALWAGLAGEKAGSSLPPDSLVNVTPAISDPVKDGGRAAIADSWQLRLDGPVEGLGAGDNDTFYIFTGTYGNTVYAIDKGGQVEWQYQVPDEWRAINDLDSKGTGTLYAVDNGTMYLYVRENRTTLFNQPYPTADTIEDQPLQNDGLLRKVHFQLKDGLLAISPEGRQLWFAPIGDEYHFHEDTSITAKNGRIYVFDNYNETVLGENGSVLFKIGEVASPCAVDDVGYCYVVTVGPYRPTGPTDSDDPYVARANLEWLPRQPANETRAYYPNGTLYWAVKTPSQIVRELRQSHPNQAPGAVTLPLHQKDTLYVPFTNGIEAIYTNGSVRWVKDYGEQQMWLASADPMDSLGRVSIYLDEGTVYLKKGGYGYILPDGTDTILDGGQAEQGQYPEVGYEVSHTSNGERYSLYSGRETDGATIRMQIGSYPLLAEVRPVNLQDISLTDLGNDTITAETDTGKRVWNRTIIPRATNATLSRENARWLITPYFSRIFVGNMTCVNSEANVASGDGLVYAGIYDSNLEWPVALGQSRCAYFSGLYALDSANGSIVWEKRLEYPVAGMVARDGAIIYATRDGTVAREQVIKPANSSAIVGPGPGITMGDVGKVAGGAAGGVAVTAVIVYVLKFLGGAGAVSRARDRLVKNRNRNEVLEFIVANPGSTMQDIAQALDMNVGTARYHIFILDLNHRVAGYKADAKFVRYFPCTGTYSPEERIALSLLKREGIRRLLSLLLLKPGLSNGEICRELDMHDSAISRYTRELVEKGVIERSTNEDGRVAYAVKSEYRETISGAVAQDGKRTSDEGTF